jgi:hypothetical protein
MRNGEKAMVNKYLDMTEVAAKARSYGFGIMVIGKSITLTKNKSEVFHTTSWRLLDDWLSGYEMGLEARK